jgi:multicomponent K+:H+ antiporter subunit D
MSSSWPIFPILLPLIGGILALFARPAGLRLQRTINLAATLILLALSLKTLLLATSQGTQVYLLGNWSAPFGIVMVLDGLSALMLAITAVLALFALVYAIIQNTDREGEHFHVLFQIQLFGLNGAFLTGDLFNLFVFFEVLLLASYGLLLHGGGRLRTKGGLHYVVINLIGSALFLFAVGALYGVLGTLNMADLAAKMAHISTGDQGIVAAAALLLLVVFGIKAAMFPLYLWLPGAYATTSAPVSALFAIMTKVGLYAMIRVHGTLFGDGAGALAALHTDVLLWLGLISLIMAAFGVFAARGLKEQAAFLVLASVATLMIGISINTTDALSASLYYLIHSTWISAALFLLADLIARGRGSFAARLRTGPAMSGALLLGSLFLAAAVAITGMPPLSGFFGKVLLLDAALGQPAQVWIFAVILFSSLLMMIAMARSGSLLFYQVKPDEDSDGESLNKRATGLVTLMLLLSPALVVAAGCVTGLTTEIAAQLGDTSAYIHAVLSQPASVGR